MSTCRSCDAEIRWARTIAGKAMPLNRDPDPNGNVVLRDGVAVVLGPLERTIAEEEGELLLMPHHATCVDPPRRSTRHG